MNLTSPVFRYDELDSTNSEAKRRAVSSDFAPCWIVADSQTAGRGRLQRSWSSPLGNVYSTALFHEPAGLAVATRLPFALALAVRDTCLNFVPDAPLLLKWPNDVRVEGEKISGILVETGTNSTGLWVAAGIGINVASSPDDAAKPATSLSELGAGPGANAQTVFEALREAFVQRLAQARSGFSGVRADWMEHAEAVGQSVSVMVSNTLVEGVLEDMDEFGGLILRLPSGEPQTIRAGDVNLVGRA